MPINKSGTYFYLNPTEKVKFKLLETGIETSKSGRTIRLLAPPHYVHISKVPFYGTNRKRMECVGPQRCELCLSKLRPSTQYRVKIELTDDAYGEQNGTVKIYDMPATAHHAIAAIVQQMTEEQKSEDTIKNTIFELERLPSRTPPFYTARIVQEPALVVENVDDFEITEDDLRTLRKLDAALRLKQYANPRQAVINTLRMKFKWSDVKIEVALNTALDENGYLREQYAEK